MDNLNKSGRMPTFQGFQELKCNLPRIAKALGVPESELVILPNGAGPYEYMHNPLLTDRVVDMLPLYGMPCFMAVDRKHHKGVFKGRGTVIYETRFMEKPIRWAFFATFTPAMQATFASVAVRGTIFRLGRYFRRMTARDIDVKPPILPEGMLTTLQDNTLGFLKHEASLKEYGVKMRRGLLLTGPPGNGKTMACAWIRKLCKANNVSNGVVTGGEIDSVFKSGDSLDELFSQDTVTFFDDIDVGFLNRAKGDGKIACAVLAAMDGVVPRNHTIKIFTTNEDLNDIDPAFLRPGRIDVCVEFPKPTRELREQFIRERWHPEILAYLEGPKLLKLLHKTEDFSFAEVDAIRTLLVTNKLMGSKTWDLDGALLEFHAGRETFKVRKKRSVGFVDYDDDDYGYQHKPRSLA